MTHRAFRSVLHGHHPEIGLASLHGVAHLGYVAFRHETAGETEVLNRGLVREGRERAEKRYLKRLFKRNGRAHYLAEDMPYGGGGKRPFIQEREPLINLALPLRRIHLFIFFEFDSAYLDDMAGPLIERLQEFRVYCIYLFP